MTPSRLYFLGEGSGPVFLGVSVFMINPAASEMLGFFLGIPALRSGEGCRRVCIRFSKSGVEVSINAAKSGMLCGRDMVVNSTVRKWRVVERRYWRAFQRTTRLVRRRRHDNSNDPQCSAAEDLGGLESRPALLQSRLVTTLVNDLTSFHEGPGCRSAIAETITGTGRRTAVMGLASRDCVLERLYDHLDVRVVVQSLTGRLNANGMHSTISQYPLYLVASGVACKSIESCKVNNNMFSRPV